MTCPQTPAHSATQTAAESAAERSRAAVGSRAVVPSRTVVRSRTAASAAGVAILGTLLMAQGCGVFGVASKLGDAIEHEKQVEVLAKYRGLENKTVAVVVNADRGVHYDYPTVVPNVLGNVATGIKTRVSGAKVLPPAESLGWCLRTPNWPSMPLGEIAKDLGVERVVVVDIFEFRLNPAGNRWIWDGAAAANIGIIEADSLDPDAYAEEYSVTVKFPEEREVARDSEKESMILTGLTAKFIQTINKLFYDHMEYKYPGPH